MLTIIKLASYCSISLNLLLGSNCKASPHLTLSAVLPCLGTVFGAGGFVAVELVIQRVYTLFHPCIHTLEDSAANLAHLPMVGDGRHPLPSSLHLCSSSSAKPLKPSLKPNHPEMYLGL